jgi:hypothetical protein
VIWRYQKYETNSHPSVCQLVRIPNPALVPIASDVNEDMETSNDSQKTLWEEFLRLQPKPRTRQKYGKSIDYFCRFAIANAA